MKKLLLAVLAAIAIAGVVQTDANAGGVLQVQRLAWKFPANVTTPPFTQATKALAAGGTDTTIWVGTEGWYMPDINSTDSLIVARFLVFVDSSAAYAAAQTTLTAVIDGAVAPDARNSTGSSGAPLVNFGSVSMTLTPTTGDDVMSIPIFIAGVNQVSVHSGSWATIPPYVRLRLSSSAAINCAGVAIQYVSPTR